MKVEVIQFVILRVKYLILVKFILKTVYDVCVCITVYRKIFEGYINGIRYSVET